VGTGSGIGSTFAYRRYSLTGFDGSNNPVWSSVAQSPITTFPATTANNVYNTNIVFNTINMRTTGNNIIWFGPDITNNVTGRGYRLGSIPIGGTTWRQLNYLSDSTTYNGPYPGFGQSPCCRFENGNSPQYGGGVFGVLGNLIITGYHGEFWKNSQTNYYVIWDDSTFLPIVQFGASWYEYLNTPNSPNNRQFGPPGVAGNALSGSLVQGTNGKYYLYHGDETIHNGIARWRLDSVVSISRQTANYPVAGPGAPIVPGTDLLAGLVNWRGLTLANNAGGWVRSPTADYNNGTGYTTTVVGRKSLDKTLSPDLSITNQINSNATSSFFTYRLLNNGARSQSWSLNTQILFDNEVDNPNQAPPYNNGAFVEVVDSVGKIITEFHISTNFGSFQYVVANGNNFYQDSTGLSIYRAKVRFSPLSFSYNSGVLTINYNGWSKTVTTPFDAGADMTYPYNIRLRFLVVVDQGGGSRVGKSIAIQNTYFSGNVPYQCTTCPWFFKFSRKR
jgi:hypothetical protein